MLIEKLKEFSEKIKVLRNQKNDEKNSSEKKLRGSFEEHNIVDLSDKFISSSPFTATQLMPENLDEKIEIMINQKWYGFEDNNSYIQFYKFINQLRLIVKFHKVVDEVDLNQFVNL